MSVVKQIAGGVPLGAALLLALTSAPAQAGFIETLTEQGGDVVASGSGTMDLIGLSYQFSTEFYPTYARVFPEAGDIGTGPLGSYTLDVYAGLSGPSMFGFGARTIVSYGSGEPIFLTGFGGGLATTQTHSLFEGPFTLSSTSTYTGQSFTTLGVTPGTYEWTWGTGPNQNYTLIIGSSSPGPMPVPEPASAALLGAAVVGFGALYRRRRI